MSLLLSRSEPFLLATFLDVVERLVVATLFAFFVYRMLEAFRAEGNPIYLAITFSEGLVVVLILIRRVARIVSLRPGDWLLALGATAAPLSVTATAGRALLPAAVCALLTIAGLLLQIYAKLTLRRSFGIIAANRGVTTGGPYRFVRHPMYSAYMLTWIGFFLVNPSLANAVIYAFAFACQVARLMAEERLLDEDPSYRAFAE